MILELIQAICKTFQSCSRCFIKRQTNGRKSVLLLLAFFAPFLNQAAFAADKIRVETKFDARGQVLRKSQPYKLGDAIRWSEFHHDGLDRQIRLTHPDGSSVRTNFLPGEKFTAVESVDENQNKQASHFDAFGNEVHRDHFEDNSRLRTRYRYDVLSRLIDIQDPKGSVFRYSYDGHGNKIFDVDPNLGCREMVYDAGNRLLRQRSSSGAMVSYTYDNLGRVTTKTADKDALEFSDCTFPIVPGSRTESGSAGNDQLDAGKGRLSEVTLNGGAGNDTYLIHVQSGHVVIPVAAETASGGTDTIRFVDLSLSDLFVTSVTDPQNGEMLHFTWSKYGNSGSLKVGHLGQHIERFEFADGTAVRKVGLTADGRVQLFAADASGSNTIIGTAQNDYLFGGSGADHLDVGEGTGPSWQYMRGDQGDDTYVFSKGSGRVYIDHTEGAGDGTDTVVFKDLSLSDLSFSTMDYTASNPSSPAGVAIRFMFNDGVNNAELRIANMGDNIERFEFADGTAIRNIELLDDGRVQLFAADVSGPNIIIGTVNDDYIFGGSGADHLDAGRGSAANWQYLRGDQGNDTYYIGQDAGWVYIDDTEGAGDGTDTVVFKDLTLSDLTISTFDYTASDPTSPAGVAIRFRWLSGTTNSELRIANMGDHIERFEFADGSAVRKVGLTPDNRVQLFAADPTGANTMIGTAQDDYLYGGSGADHLDPRAGSAANWQLLRGDQGNDTYSIGQDAGWVYIDDTEGAGDGTDTVVFKDLTLFDLTLSTFDYTASDPTSPAGVAIRFRWLSGTTNSELRIANMGDHIERFEFADGTAIRKIELLDDGRIQLFAADAPGSITIIGTPLDDYLYGGPGADHLDAGRGSAANWQYLRGDQGNDTYYVGQDAGWVYIDDTEGAGDGTDTVVFKDLTLSDLTISTFDYTASDPTSPAGVAIRFRWLSGTTNSELRIANMGDHIERFEFADGTAVRKVGFTPDNRVQLFAADPTGANTMIGTAQDDYLYGGSGADHLDPRAGSAANWQLLRGDQGNDTYSIGQDAGWVYIDDTEGAGDGTDTVVFKDLTLSDLTISTFDYTASDPTSPAGIAIRFRWLSGTTNSELRIANMGDHIEQFEFADGTIKTAVELRP